MTGYKGRPPKGPPPHRPRCPLDGYYVEISARLIVAAIAVLVFMALTR